MKGVLSLCVANSARSQMAEGIARALLPPEVKIWSAGSRPTCVQPEALGTGQEGEFRYAADAACRLGRTDEQVRYRAAAALQRIE